MAKVRMVIIMALGEKGIKRDVQRIIFQLFFVFVLLLCRISLCDAARTVKVGYIDYEGFIESVHNEYQGYGVDYLEEIAKQSNLRFTFEKDTWQNCLNKLLTGEIDLVCTAQKTPSRILLYNFSKYPLGTEATIVYSRLNDDICFEEFDAFNGKTLGMLQGSFQSEIFASYAAEHHFSCRNRYYNDEAELLQALNSGEVDLILSGSLARHSGLKVVSEFGSDEFYFMANKNDVQLMNALDEALDKIRVKKPSIALELYKKWYGSAAAITTPNYTRAEVNFIKTVPDLTIGLLTNYDPVSYYDRKTNRFEGIVPDILALIAQKSGLHFNYVPLKTNVDPITQLLAGGLDMAAGMVNNRALTGNGKILISASFLDSPLSALGRQGETINLHRPLYVAVVKNAYTIIKDVRRFYPQFYLVYVDSPFEGAMAVKNHKADLYIMNSYVLNNLLQRPQLEGLTTVPAIHIASGNSFISGIGYRDERLMSIINKTIDILATDDVNLIITNNTVAKPYKPTVSDLAYQYRYPLVVVVILLIACLALLFYAARVKLNALRVLEERNTQLKNAVAMAERASEAKSRFLASMSHDIRTPLNAIIGLTSIAIDDFQAQDIDIKTFLDKIFMASKNLLGIVNNVLDMSAIENEKLKISKRPFELQTLLNAEVAIYQEECRRRGIAFVTDFKLLSNLREIGDQNKITRVLDNIISNAYKFTEHGGTIRFAVEEEKHDAKTVILHITVADNGCGMSEEMQKKLFTPFEQERGGVIRNNAGTGLGMSITKSMISLMNGKITFESSYGEGTTFYVTLLLGYEPRKQASKEGKAVIAAEKPLDFHGQRILLAEDNRINAEIAMILLKKVNLQVELASNGKIAVDKFKAHATDKYYGAIMMDIQMPELDGYGATKAIRSINTPWAKKIPIVAITANAFSEDIAMAISVGMNNHVSKPIDKKHLYKVLAKHLS